ncbi:MAG: hypothetical protein ACJ74H_16675 [Thermoanaerobaculia bacterium]
MDIRQQATKVAQRCIDGLNNHHADLEPSEILLVSHSLIYGQQHIEGTGGASQQIAVLKPVHPSS